jgi:uncharacterized membrane protein
MTAPPGPAFRRRLDNFALRWHARLDSDWSDRSLPWILAGVAFALLGSLALARHRQFGSGTDLAVYSQAAWLIEHGHRVHLTVVGFSLLDLEGSLLFYPVAQLARLPAPEPQILLVLQSAALALAVLPLWRLARRVVALRVGAATALVVAYVLYPAVQNSNLADFHPVSLAVPLLAAFCYFGLSGSTIRYSLCGAAAVLLGAELALLVGAFGVLLALTGRRRAGLATALLAAAWIVLSLRVSWLGAGDSSFLAPGAFAQYGSNALGVVGHWLAHPVETASQLLARQNFELAVYLVLPLAFVPLVAFRYVAPTLPWLFLVAMSDAPEGVQRTSLVVGVVPFLLVATAFGLARLGRPTIERISVPPRVVAALLAAAVVFFVSSSDSSPYAHPWDWGTRDETDEARVRALDDVADDLPVAATPHLLTALSRRVALYRYVPGQAPPDDVELVLTDAADGATVGASAAPADFALIEVDHGISTYRRRFVPAVVRHE